MALHPLRIAGRGLVYSTKYITPVHKVMAKDSQNTLVTLGKPPVSLDYLWTGCANGVYLSQYHDRHGLNTILGQVRTNRYPITVQPCLGGVLTCEGSKPSFKMDEDGEMEDSLLSL
jgi:hypothetical protein